MRTVWKILRIIGKTLKWIFIVLFIIFTLFSNMTMNMRITNIENYLNKFFKNTNTPEIKYAVEDKQI